MYIKTQSPNINTLKTQKINQTTNKSSGKVAVTANRLQNNTEQYPMASKKKVRFLENSQMKELSSQETTSKLSENKSIDALTKKELLITSEKTIHKQDIKDLRNHISKSLDLISKQIKKIGTSDGRRCKITLPKDTMNKFNNILLNLKDNIQHYKNELGRSTYQHNSNKEKTLSKLEDKLNNTAGKFIKSEGRNNYLSRDSSVKQTNNTFENTKQRQEDYKNGNGYY
ncbi:hypothetical protein [Providencia sp. PROV164]|uniref:hypothetical protein n=1 Tax=Providencia sp. PROV164 TaxID=2949871 RepID=UPI00234A61D2|nr:hypothetical protein [Providencia sp. PROV164]